MSTKKNNREEILGIVSLIYSIFIILVFIFPSNRFLNSILEKIFEIQPFKEGWFIIILTFLSFPAILIGLVYAKILYDRFKFKDNLFSNHENHNQNTSATKEQIWKLDKKTVECSNSLCRGQVRLTKYKEGFVKCPHCGHRFYART